jgi:isopropylmalate/homocitrate/citramalate synthase
MAPRIPTPQVLLDTTLRDGEQAPGVALTPAEKAEYVRRAEAVGLRYIEVGFPQNAFDFEGCAAAVEAARDARVVAMALTTSTSIEAVSRVGAHEVLFVVPSSASHLRHVYGEPLDRLLGALRDSVEQAWECGLAVNVGLEDASERDYGLIRRILKTLEPLADKVDCITVPDTRGQLLPSEVWPLLAQLREHLSGFTCRLAFHAHDDLGLATANSLAALQSQPPVDCVHVTACGFGERAGNASIEQLAILLAMRLGRGSGLDLTRLPDLVTYASEIFLTPVSAHSPVVGWKVFLHESGLHQRGLLEDATTYQVFDPASVGAHTGLVLGKHSGRALRRRIERAAGCSEADVLRLQASIVCTDKERLRAEFRRCVAKTESCFLAIDMAEAERRLRDTMPASVEG